VFRCVLQLQGNVACRRVFLSDARSASGSNPLFFINPTTGEISVNSGLIKENYTTHSIVVRATSNGQFARTLLPGCNCTYRSDVVVNIQVTSMLNFPLYFMSGTMSACTYVSRRSVVVVAAFPGFSYAGDFMFLVRPS
jgi:hypothetical protein